MDGPKIINPSWEKHTYNIYKPQLPKDISNFLLMVNNKLWRWPKTTFENNQIYDKHYRVSSFEGDYKTQVTLLQRESL
jgi:hypothetical protein